MSDAIIFSCFCLIVGVLLTYALRSSKRSILPLTVGLVLIGGLIDLIVVLAYDQSIYQSLGESSNVGPFISSLLSFLHINPELALAVFLPALIFESASSLKWSSFISTLIASLLLAGPGVIVALAPVSLLAKFAFGYDWDWPHSLVLGATLAATDPVAVIALMKVLGVNERFATLIESEALLNDGTAFVLYLLLTSMMKGSGHSIGEAISQSALGSPFFGFACAIVLVTMLKRVHNDAESTILLTVAFSYAMFSIASGPLELSSILSLTVMAAYFAKVKDGVLDRHVRESLSHFWAVVGNGVNLCIFLFTGMQVMHTLLSTSDVITAKDWGLAIAVYLLLHVARYASLLMFLPLFKWSGLSLTGRHIVFIGWSGLRGGVSLLLSLIIYLDDEYDSLFRSRFMFHVSTQVLLTLAINGMTAQYVLKACKLHSDTLERRAVVSSAMLRVQVRTTLRIAEMKSMLKYETVDWTLIDEFFVPPSDEVCQHDEERDWDSVDQIVDTDDLCNHHSNAQYDPEIVSPSSHLTFSQSSLHTPSKLTSPRGLTQSRSLGSVNQYTTPFRRPMSPSTSAIIRSVTGQMSVRMARTLGVDFERQFNESLIGPDAYAILIAASQDAVNEENVGVVWKGIMKRCRLSNFDRWLQRTCDDWTASQATIPSRNQWFSRLSRFILRSLSTWSSNRVFHIECMTMECASACVHAHPSVEQAANTLHTWDRADHHFDDAPSVEQVKQHALHLYTQANECWNHGFPRARLRVLTRQAAASLFQFEQQTVIEWGNLGLMQATEVQATIDDCRERWIRFEAQCHRALSGRTVDQACQVDQDELSSESSNRSSPKSDEQSDLTIQIQPTTELEMIERESVDDQSNSDDGSPLINTHHSINESINQSSKQLKRSDSDDSFNTSSLTMHINTTEGLFTSDHRTPSLNELFAMQSIKQSNQSNNQSNNQHSTRA